MEISSLPWIKGAIVTVGGILVWVFGPWDTLIAVLLGFVVLDYIMGVIKAAALKELSSRVGSKGLAKKVGIFAMVAVAAMLDRVAPMNGAIRAAVAIFYIANEGLSILENAGALGLPMPDKLREALAQLRDKSVEKTKDIGVK